jgi:hypothetical protein
MKLVEKTYMLVSKIWSKIPYGYIDLEKIQKNYSFVYEEKKEFE